MQWTEKHEATLSEFTQEVLPQLRARRPVAVIERPKPLHESVVERVRNMIVEGDSGCGGAPARRQSRGDASGLAHARP